MQQADVHATTLSAEMMHQTGKKRKASDVYQSWRGLCAKKQPEDASANTYLCVSKDNHRAVVHGVVEDRAGKDQTIQQSDCDTDVSSSLHCLQWQLTCESQLVAQMAWWMTAPMYEWPSWSV